jgi:predicted CoA-binding protein
MNRKMIPPASPSALAADWQVRDFVRRYRRVAVVGMPADLDADAVVQAERMLGYGFQFFPVHSDCGDALGHSCVAHLHDVHGDVDIVQVLPNVSVSLVHLAKEAIQKQVSVFWVENAPVDSEVAELLAQEGIHVVAERSLEKEFFKSEP